MDSLEHLVRWSGPSWSHVTEIRWPMPRMQGRRLHRGSNRAAVDRVARSPFPGVLGRLGAGFDAHPSVAEGARRDRMRELTSRTLIGGPQGMTWRAVSCRASAGMSG